MAAMAFHNGGRRQGLKIALQMLRGEGLSEVFARHDRPAKAMRTAVLHWGFDIQCRNEAEYASTLIAVHLPEAHSADALRREILARANMSLGNGLGPLADHVFRIGHLGDFNNLTVAGTLSGIEMGLKARGIPYRKGGVEAAMDILAGNSPPAARAAD
jgi:alanine-glyoxylate transaminase/serine-glyoxylate transaminase/serine-pyruvate transaminase